VPSLEHDDALAHSGHGSRGHQPGSQAVAAVVLDERGGGVETRFKDDKQGLGLTKRSKKRAAAQRMLTLLGALAHNVMVWARRWLAPHEPKLRRYGMKRMVRDSFHLSGFLVPDARGRLVEVVRRFGTYDSRI
jgi:hypothetical protein